MLIIIINFIVNLDDKFASKFIEVNQNILTYGQNEKCDLYIKDYTITPKYTYVTFIYKNNEYLFIFPLFLFVYQ